MKNLTVTVLAMFISVMSYGQTTMGFIPSKKEVVEVVEEVKEEVSYYAALSVSNTNTVDDPLATMYPSVEFGITKYNVTFAVLAGPNSFKDNRGWAEVKGCYAFPLGNVDGFLVGGTGTYLNQKGMFIEYGVGVSYMPKRWGIFSQISSWDGTVFFTNGVSYKLNK